ncbi:MAG TPA: penicillin-binding protein 1C, partial [Steroidobacteraceae bacterium]|nr:penicillin-binding protein 1C [Steroidobacteraceae bacterium]
MKSRPLRAGVAVLAGAVLVCALGLLWPASVPEFTRVRAQWRPSDAWLLDRHGVVLERRRLDFAVRRLEWTELEAVSPALVEAIVAGEDRRFWQHGGVDWRGVAGAVRDTLLHDRRRGASTITMQVAALLPQTRITPDASPWRRKWQQVRVARGLEAHWTKPQILEAYLNLLGFRGELQGIGAAAELLAGKTPQSLDRSESLVLAALLPAPGAGLDALVARACARATGRIQHADCDKLRPVAAELLQRRRPPLERAAAAPHVAQQLLREPGSRITSTLDATVQRLAHEALTRQLARVAERNVRDGAVLVVDTQSGEVLAYVGSAGAASTSSAVDGVRALRQAGSTLKPFLYELALERGYLTAASLLDDSPVNLDTANGLYIPQNYDRVFRGPVSVRTALGNSLNVPAVRALVLTGVDAFRDRLYELGYTGLVRDGSHYGYSLALGSAEVSLWQQATAYRTLALGGAATPLRLHPSPVPAPRQVLSHAASFVVADVLADPSARALTFGTDSALATRFWSAVKTGTSKDMRDNWCVGYSPRYTVAVWVGNFEGDSMRAVTGVTGAAPVWAEIMEALHREPNVQPPVPPPGVESRLVRFTPAHEPARREWFVVGTAQSQVAAVALAEDIARIDSPAQAS